MHLVLVQMHEYMYVCMYIHMYVCSYICMYNTYEYEVTTYQKKAMISLCSLILAGSILTYLKDHFTSRANPV